MTKFHIQVKNQGNWKNIIGLMHIKYTEEEARQAVEQLKLLNECLDMPYEDYRYVQVTEQETTEPFKMTEITVGVKKKEDN